MDSMMIATVKQAIDIIKYQSMGYPSRAILAILTDAGIDMVYGYHVTMADNLGDIQQDGIKMSACYNRNDAVYLFLDRDDAVANADNIVGTGIAWAIVTVAIPSSIACIIKDDGLYNGTFSNSYSASRLEQRVQPEWIA